MRRFPAHGDVLPHRQAVEQLGALEGAAKAAPRPAGRRLPRDVDIVQRDPPGAGPDEGAAGVEGGGLARPVRADQAGDDAARGLEADRVDRLDAAEPDGKVAHRQARLGRGAAAGRGRGGDRPRARAARGRLRRDGRLPGRGRGRAAAQPVEEAPDGLRQSCPRLAPRAAVAAPTPNSRLSTAGGGRSGDVGRDHRVADRADDRVPRVADGDDHHQGHQGQRVERREVRCRCRS